MADDRHVVESLKAYLRPGMRALDVGAHAGKFAQIMAEAVGTTGRVVAVEPDPKSATGLRGNPRLTTIQAALSSVGEPDRAFWVYPPDRRHSSLVREAVSNVEKAECLTVPVLTVDAVVAQHLGGRVDAIKIDTQGSDYDVLLGAERTLADSSRLWVCVELWPAGLSYAGASVADVEALLTRHGYVPERQTWADVRTITDGYLRRMSGYLDLICVKQGVKRSVKHG